jgi:hypothetical protein
VRCGCCTLLLHSCSSALLELPSEGMIIFAFVPMFDHELTSGRIPVRCIALIQVSPDPWHWRKIGATAGEQ